jgi:hypothetical protein
LKLQLKEQISSRGAVGSSYSGTVSFEHRGIFMVICPIALVVHCSGCPIVKICPAKTIIGDYGKEKVADAAAPKKEEPPKDESAG